MFSWLISQNIKSIKRSPDFSRKLIVNIIFSVLMLLMIIDFLILGILLFKIIKEHYPDSDPVAVFNGGIIFYMISEFILRLTLQKIRSLDGKPYLILNVKRKEIVHFILLKVPGTIIGIFPLLIVIPFFIGGVLAAYPVVLSFAWLIAILILLLFNSYLVNFIKMKFAKNPVFATISAFVLICCFLVQYFDLYSFTSLSRLIFGLIFTYPVLCFIPMLMLIFIYFMNYKFLISSLYIDQINVEEKNKKYIGEFSFLKNIGETGSLITLSLKLMLRNKRTKTNLWMPLVALLYGFLIYPRGAFNNGMIPGQFWLMFAGTFITGFFIIIYGINSFSYDSNYFNFLLTNKIDMFILLKSKYYLMLLMSIPIYVLSLFYVLYGIKIIFINTVMFLFTIGTVPFLFLYMSLFNKTKFDLSLSPFSRQGKGSNQFISLFTLLLIELIIFYPIRIFLGWTNCLLVFGLLGIFGIILNNQILKIILKQFYKKKYIMSEGFRQT